MTVAEVASSIGPGLGKAALGAKVEGRIVDASYRIERDASLAVLTDTLDRYRRCFSHATSDSWAAPWAPGKWTRHQVLVHVTQWQLIFSTRIRMALAIPDYVVQPMDQDPLLEIEAPHVDVATADTAFVAVRIMNIALVAGLSREQRAKIVTHPERGAIHIEDLIVTLAGHAAHHLGQIEN